MIRNLIFCTLIVAMLSGCDSTDQSESGLNSETGSNSAVQKSSVVLPQPDGWVVSEPRTIEDDDQTSVSYSYDHPQMAVTIYKFDRGLVQIPNDLEAHEITRELASAGQAIKQAARMGIWDSALEVDSGQTTLGKSTYKAIWSKHELKKDGTSFPSFTYLWVHENMFYKVRASAQTNSGNSMDILEPLLTEIGNTFADETP